MAIISYSNAVLAGTHGTGRGIMVSQALVIILGADAAIIMSQILYWSSRKNGGWFYKSDADWQAELGFGRHVVRRCIHGSKDAPNKIALKDFGVDVQVRKANNTPTTYYRVNYDKLERSLASYHDILVERGFIDPVQALPDDNPIVRNPDIPYTESVQSPVGNPDNPLTYSTTESNTHTAPDKPSRADGKKPTHQQMIAQAVVDAIGISNPTRSEWSRAAKVGKELEEAGVAAEDFGALVQFVRNQAAGRWTVTMTSLTTNGRVSAYLAARNKSVTRDIPSGDDGVERVTMVTYDVPFETPDWLTEEHDDDDRQ